MGNHVSPFAKDFPKLPAIDGVRLASAHSGMRYKNRDDLILVELAEGTEVAGVFTKNSMCGVPIDWCKSIIDNGKTRGLIVNAGFANVFTGKKGRKICEDTASATAKALGCEQDEVFVASTGIIGIVPDGEKIKAALPSLKDGLSENNWELAAKAFMTTDTFPKGVTKKALIGDVEVNINGIIKGSGMIEPDMATMLGYVFTDAKIPAGTLQRLLSEDAEHTYNCMTVDSDTSTSDMILVFATGQKKHAEITGADSEELSDFREKLKEVHTEMAKLVAMDGEGITKFMTVNVKGAENFNSARTIAKAIANSPLWKTAVSAEDPNWGRVIAAIGKSGEATQRDKTSLWIGDVLVAENGSISSGYKEEQAAEHMKQPEISLTVDVGVGDGEATVWTMDLTHEYISINADYRS